MKIIATSDLHSTPSWNGEKIGEMADIVSCHASYKPTLNQKHYISYGINRIPRSYFPEVF